jgi:hypothetical protein
MHLYIALLVIVYSVIILYKLDKIIKLLEMDKKDT